MLCRSAVVRQPEEQLPELVNSRLKGRICLVTGKNPFHPPVFNIDKSQGLNEVNEILRIECPVYGTVNSPQVIISVIKDKIIRGIPHD